MSSQAKLTDWNAVQFLFMLCLMFNHLHLGWSHVKERASIKQFTNPLVHPGQRWGWQKSWCNDTLGYWCEWIVTKLIKLIRAAAQSCQRFHIDDVRGREREMSFELQRGWLYLELLSRGMRAIESGWQGHRVPLLSSALKTIASMLPGHCLESPWSLP